MFRGFTLHSGSSIITNTESDILKEHLFKQITESMLFKYVISFVALKPDKAGRGVFVKQHLAEMITAENVSK